MLHFVVFYPLLCEVLIYLAIEGINPMFNFGCYYSRLVSLLIELLLNIPSVIRYVMDVIVGISK